ncbi:MAG: EamA family transporter [Candidatus Dormibacteraceae bacterium]
MKGSVKVGYAFAVLNAVISGIAIFVSSRGVGIFHNAVLFTSLKNGVVGIILIPLFLAVPGPRRGARHLSRSDWIWLLIVAIIGGSLPYALFFTGLKMTTAVTGALGDHVQFLLVAVLAVLVLKERLSPAMWAGILVLLVGVLLGANLGLVRWNLGTVLIGAATILFTVDFVIVKHLLGGRLHLLLVMTAKMTLGSAILFAFLGVTGGLAAIAHLSSAQWIYAVVTGLILLCFTASIFIAIRYAPVSSVMAIGAGAPLVTVALELVAEHRVKLAGGGLLGLLLTFVAVVAILVLGLHQEARRKTRPERVTATRSQP